ncbi:PmeII family type II restriction endonuclease [Pseudanabaena sp. PCC 6802]|uniref:PmeII family type II restriction endonuclease n=1 Tax=Pseudanabaena sp. PCC 6802 TaxID=118173 RepID=UPI0003462BE6|nr:PmeII family type II restriction endonuclease [Pseudanabaena sp. PCC 6802]
MSDRNLEILEKAKQWFRDTIAINHIANTKKLKKSSEFNINPFLAVYLANFLTGNSSALSIAKALIYPRALGTSITTSFGTNIQKFTNDVLESFGSTTSGIDIEFIDQIDNQKKFCQLKAGPNTINSDDVETIADHFSSAIRLARTNNVRISFDDMIVGVIYGRRNELSGHYKRITSQYHYHVYVGKEFWHRLTGDPEFYEKLISAIGSVATEADYSRELDEVIKQLAEQEVINQLSEQEDK